MRNVKENIEIGDKNSNAKGVSPHLITLPRHGLSKAVIAAVLLLLAQGVAVGTIAWHSNSEGLELWISGGIALCCIVSSMLLAKRRVAFPLVFQGCLMLFVGWIVMEGISYFANDRHVSVCMLVLSMLITVLLMGAAALFLVQTKSALKWFSNTAIAQWSGLAEKIKRGVWTVLIADVLLLAFVACLDLDTAIWSKDDFPDMIQIGYVDEFLDDKFVITDFSEFLWVRRSMSVFGRRCMALSVSKSLIAVALSCLKIQSRSGFLGRGK